MHQGNGGLSEVDNKGQGLASVNVKGQVVGVNVTVQQFLKERVLLLGPDNSVESH